MQLFKGIIQKFSKEKIIFKIKFTTDNIALCYCRDGVLARSQVFLFSSRDITHDIVIAALSNVPSKYFNVGSTLFLGLYDAATSHNVKSTLKQRCVYQRCNLQRLATLKQHCVFQR